jgi:O-antigen biosynthesis protein
MKLLTALNFAKLKQKFVEYGGARGVIQKAWVIVRNQGFRRLVSRVQHKLKNSSKQILPTKDTEYWRLRDFKVVPYYLNPYSDGKFDFPADVKVGVHLHVFYLDMLEHISEYLSNIPVPFDLYISSPSDETPDSIRAALVPRLERAQKVVIRKTPNRGRDIAPMIIEYGQDLLKYDFIAHIHTKKSAHNSALTDWFDEIMELLFGSASNIKQIFGLLSKDARFVYPAPNPKIWMDESGWGENYFLAKDILSQKLREKIENYPTVEFPQGSMFWAKSRAMVKFLTIPLKYSDFPAEPIPADGTLAHVLERFLLIAANKTPGRNYRIYSSNMAIREAYYETQQDYTNKIVHNTVKVLSYYLPQFYPTPENDQWHGEGFTEWTKVRSANPLFFGHDQQRAPHQDIGYYFLTTSEVLKKQAGLMKKAGVSGQIFYHYWFTGKLILEKPAQMLLADKSIEMPFCFCWANENWTKKWDGNEREILLGQQYSEADAVDFITYLIPFFQDARYIKVAGRPVLFVYRPASIPDFSIYKAVWEKVCAQHGIPAPFVVAVLTRGAKSPHEFEMDAGCERVLHDWTDGNVRDVRDELHPYWPINGPVLNYSEVADYYMKQDPNKDYPYFRSIIPSWDNTPRYASEAYIVHQSTPEMFQSWLESLIIDAKNRLPQDQQFVVINAWNEWAESAVLEPDARFGYAYLNSIGRALSGVANNDREYLCQAIPESIQVLVTVKEPLLQTLKQNSVIRAKMLFCLAHSSLFSCCQVVFEQPELQEWFALLSTIAQPLKDGISPNYTLYLKEVCYFPPDTLENMLKMALFYDAGVVTPSVKNSGDFSHEHSYERWEIGQFKPYIFLLKNNDKRSTKCCVDANIFISQVLPENLDAPISTIIRFSSSGNLSLLQNALYSLIAQSGCVVQPILAVQDLADDELTQLNRLLESMPWHAKYPPIIKRYFSTPQNLDLRSLMLNDALRLVRTKYAAFLDYDDILFHGAYQWLTGRLRKTGKNASFGLIYSTIFNLAEQKIKNRQDVYNYGRTYKDFFFNNFVPLHGFMLNMSTINVEDIIFFPDMKYLEDYYLTLQIFTNMDTDWEALALQQFIGDYYHYEDKSQTLAFLNPQLRQNILSGPEYILSRKRIDDLKQKLKPNKPG